ncbi:MAG TPA: FHA domain-containing protein [Homoserinimonas sp.]|nr:FHA domain-containing protein [Homoserinimonas sp.]
MERDLDDTVIRPLRPLELAYPDDSDTVVRARRPVPESAGELPAHSDDPTPDAANYGFVVNSHQPIGLDRPAYLGRKPSPPRIASGSRPRLVRVPSPLGEVSSTHLELRQEGTMVIATDLKSTNGTQVRLPGSAPIRLRQGESIVVTPGSLIEIGDGNVIEILSLRRAYPPDPHLGATHS